MLGAGWGNLNLGWTLAIMRELLLVVNVIMTCDHVIYADMF